MTVGYSISAILAGARTGATHAENELIEEVQLPWIPNHKGYVALTLT